EAEIDEREVERPALKLRQRRAPGRDRRHLAADRAEAHAQRRADVLLVVDHQDARAKTRRNRCHFEIAQQTACHAPAPESPVLSARGGASCKTVWGPVGQIARSADGGAALPSSASVISSLRQRLFGKPRNLRDPRLFHHVSLVAFFAWVGLGADGLSSSAYGPDEAFRHLDGHYYLAVFLAVALALTVFIISYGYSRIIEHFPSGGGGYVVASKLLGERAGLVSGSALLVDYVLTISISVASGANAVFAFLPPQWQQAKLTTEFVVIALLIVMNLRGVKESVLVLTPIFLVFLVTHVILIGGVVGSRLGEAGEVVREVRAGLHHDLVVDKMTWGALLLVFFRAYSLGGSSY